MSNASESSLVRFLVIALVASFAVVPMTFYGCSPEWARWDASQANAFFKEGETYEALYQLRDAIGKSPRDPVLKLTLAGRLIDMDQADEALQLAIDVLEVYPDNIRAMEIKSRSEQLLGDFEAALETQVEIDENLHVSLRKFHSLNMLAYARALANKDLNLAKDDIETAVLSLNRITSWEGDCDTPLRLEVKGAILAALVSRRCDARQEPLAIMTDQIGPLRETAAELRNDLAGAVYKEAGKMFPVRQDGPIKSRRQELRFFETQLACLLSCRALLYQDLGETEKCQGDRVEVRSLGYDSSKIVAEFPDDRSALMRIDSISAILDTRGFICSLLPWREELEGLDRRQYSYLSSYSDALGDLNVSIACNRASRKSFGCSLRNSFELSFDRDRELAQLKRNEAVLLYHRMKLHQRQGAQELAEQDAQSIRDLDEDPDSALY